MQYAVVSFINEYIDEENVVSEVPLTWLHTKNTMCKWPPKHESFHILKYSVPKHDWTDHPIKCERICGSREEARRKCIRNPEDDSSTATDIDMGRKFRKKRPNKLLTNYYTNCPSPPHFDDDTDNEGSEVPEATQHVQLPQIEAALVYQELQPSTQPEAIQDLPLPQIEGPLVYEELQFPAQPQAIQDLPLPQVEALVYQELLPPTQPTNMTNAEIQSVSDHQPIVFNRGRPTTVEEKLDHIINLLGGLKLEIDDLKWNKHNGYSATAPQVPDLNLNVPLKSVEELKAFEAQVIGDPEFKQQLVKYLQHIGGMSGKDLHARCYKRMFTHSLCEECSWKGFRKNYKMEDLAVTKCIYDAVNGTFPTTFKEFEILTRDYLRHAKQRKEREEKK